MTHDPLCPRGNPEHEDDTHPDFWCKCLLIAKVREDAIAAAVQRVEVLYSKGHFIWDDGSELYGIPHKRDVMTAIKGEQP
jgi:hypothetical protein